MLANLVDVVADVLEAMQLVVHVQDGIVLAGPINQRNGFDARFVQVLLVDSHICVQEQLAPGFIEFRRWGALERVALQDRDIDRLLLRNYHIP